MARPKVHLDLAELEKLYNIQCTDQEVAAFLGVSVRTILRRKKSAQFAEIVERAQAKGRVSVRRNLFRLASSGNVAAAIFLSKNLLGYRDVLNNEHSGPQGGPIQVENTRPDLSQLSDEELHQLRLITEKTRTARGN